MKPSYATVKKNHYSSDDMNSSYVSAERAYEELGYDINLLIKQNPGYINTSALRMSLALLKSGVQFNGRLKVKKRLNLSVKFLSQAQNYSLIS